MTLYECGKCARQFTSNAATPRCTDRDCTSTNVKIIEETVSGAIENDGERIIQIKNDIHKGKSLENTMCKIVDMIDEQMKNKTQKTDSMDQFDNILVEHARRLSRIQLLHAMTYGGHTPETQREANTALSQIIDSLRKSNESLVDSLATASTEQTAAETEIAQNVHTQQNDPIQQILKFAGENPEAVKEFLAQVLPKKTIE